MGARLWTALLLLAAVFAMHGVRCVAAEPALAHGSTSLDAVASIGAPAAAIHVGAVTAEKPAHSHAAATHGSRDVAATVSTDLPAPWHDAHVLAMCLAVLLAGLTILGALTRVRGMAIPLVRGSPPPRRWLTGWVRQPRPPDLSALCLLRI
ncbi:DUF6153 family protein [Blastococcus capsensis]|uniref:DUF6153 family protein n=1 Tax=Blastococcus capsensis TaxID=1564163 RepID=UPI003D6BD219